MAMAMFQIISMVIKFSVFNNPIPNKVYHSMCLPPL